MLDLIPQGWPGVICIACIVSAIVMLGILAVLAIQDARERQIKKLIDYAARKFAEEHLRLSASLLFSNSKEKNFSYKITSIPEAVSDMEDKLHHLGDKLQGKTIMGKPIRDKSGKFTKEKN